MTISDKTIEEVRRVSEANNRVVTNRERFNIPEGFSRAIVEYAGTGSTEVIAYVKYPTDARILIAKLRDTLSDIHFESKIADAEAE